MGCRNLIRSQIDAPPIVTDGAVKSSVKRTAHAPRMFRRFLSFGAFFSFSAITLIFRSPICLAESRALKSGANSAQIAAESEKSEKKFPLTGKLRKNFEETQELKIWSVPQSSSEDPANLPADASSQSACQSTMGPFQLTSLVTSQSSLPDGGRPNLTAATATANSAGEVAFVSNVSNSARNQGIFVVRGSSIREIARGCGGGGGSGNHGDCGDASPAGGKFAGFFLGTFFAPAINNRGDVLFLADLVGAESSRGLFLYQGKSQRIKTVALQGRGPIRSVGPGSLNNKGDVVFIGRSSANPDLHTIFQLKDGVLSEIVHSYQRIDSLGGTVGGLAGGVLGFVDGTEILYGPPSINDAGKIVIETNLFRSTDPTPQLRSAVLLLSGNQWSSPLSLGSAAPIPGYTFENFSQPSINNRDEIAFYAGVIDNDGLRSSGWFAGNPRRLRKVVMFGDTVDGEAIVRGLAFPWNPYQVLDDCGNVLFYAEGHVTAEEAHEYFFLNSARSGNQVVVRGPSRPPYEWYMNPWGDLTTDGRGAVLDTNPRLREISLFDGGS
jgi:hypothetical protein